MTAKTIQDIVDNYIVPENSENLYIPKLTDNVKLFILQEEYLPHSAKMRLDSIKTKSD